MPLTVSRALLLTLGMALCTTLVLARHMPVSDTGVGYHSPVSPAHASEPLGIHEIPVKEILSAPTQHDVDVGVWHEPTEAELTPRVPPAAVKPPAPPTVEPPAPPPVTKYPPRVPKDLEVTRRKPGHIRIGSWNMLNLSQPRELDRRAEIIARFDIIGMQEVKKPATLNKLRRKLQDLTGATWHRSVSPRVGVGQKSEHMAFLYRTDRVQYNRRGARGVYQPKRRGNFSRPPYYATFKAGNFDFTLIDYHAAWGNSREISTEIERLHNVIEQVQTANGPEQDVILLGDFNRDRPEHKAFHNLRRAGMMPLIDMPGGFTTYSSGENRIGANLYDGIWIPRRHTRHEFSGTADIFYPHEEYFLDRPLPHNAARLRLSDHCPVWAEFRTDLEDDD